MTLVRVVRRVAMLGHLLANIETAHREVLNGCCALLHHLFRGPGVPIDEESGDR